MTISSCCFARPRPRAPFDRVCKKGCSLPGQSQRNWPATCKPALHIWIVSTRNGRPTRRRRRSEQCLSCSTDHSVRDRNGERSGLHAGSATMSENRQTRGVRITIVRSRQGGHMATLRREIPVATGATPVWQKLRDFGAGPHQGGAGLPHRPQDGQGRSHRHLLQRHGGARAAGHVGTTRPAGWSMRSSKAARATTTPPSRSSPKATAAASCGRSTFCPTNSRRRSAA